MDRPPVNPKTASPGFPTPTLAEDIFNAVESIVCVVNGEGQVVYVTPAVERILGFPVSELLGYEWWDKVYAYDRELGRTTRDRLVKTARGEAPVFPEAHSAPASHASGREVMLLWRDAKGPGDLVIGVAQDITALRQAEMALEQRDCELEAAFDQASDGILILDSNWIYQSVNPAACRIFGKSESEIIGKEHGKLLRSSIEVPGFRQQAVKKGVYTVGADFERADGEVRRVEVSITTDFRPGHHLMIMRDVTERNQLQTQVMQARHLEGIGRLAGGVAHDFNNMLTAIRGYAELLQKKLGGDPRSRYVEGIMGASLRATETTQQLLAFSRKQHLNPVLLDLNRAVLDTIDLLRRLIGEDIELLNILGDDVGTVMLDPGQFSQVLINLAVNSRDAMPGGGRLIIETRRTELDENYVLRHIQVQPGIYAMLAVTDTGSGIPPEVMRHIFEPFFTTKEQGKGTGLGLATVYGIVKQSNGYVWVYSEPGQGTTFKLYFPCVDQQAEVELRAEASNRTILLIEDDSEVRCTAQEALTELGFRVLSAADGSEALTRCQSTEQSVDLVLTDITAAGLSGEDLMGYFAVRFPRAPIVHMSGFPRSRLESAHTISKDALFLAKPFTVEQLREIVERALEVRESSPR